MPKHKFLLVLFTIAVSLFTVSLAQAQGPQPTDDEVNAIAKQLYCPVCPNTPLDVCETQACADWRAQIRDQLAAGWSEEAIITYFVDQYGERVLAEPQREGFNSLIWVLPIVVLLLGLFIALQALRSWQQPAPAPGDPERTAADLPADVRARIEQELRELI